MATKKTNKQNVEKKVRYSDAELAVFEQVILTKLTKAKENLSFLTQVNVNEHGTDDTATSFKILEEGNQVMSKEEVAIQASRQQKFINNLEAALLRIKNKTYGICPRTGELIDKGRLMSVPHTTSSIEVKLNQPVNGKPHGTVASRGNSQPQTILR